MSHEIEAQSGSGWLYVGIRNGRADEIYFSPDVSRANPSHTDRSEPWAEVARILGYRLEGRHVDHYPLQQHEINLLFGVVVSQPEHITEASEVTLDLRQTYLDKYTEYVTEPSKNSLGGRLRAAS